MSISIRGQFQRSINLSRDFYGDHDLSGYVVTAKSRELLERIIESLAKHSAQRAWSVTGPYGGGKSAFALFAAHLLRGSRGAHARLSETFSELSEEVQKLVPDEETGVFCPVLIVGSRGPISKALLKGLAKSLSTFSAHYRRRTGRPPREVEELREVLRSIWRDAEELEDPTDADVIELYQDAAAAVHEATGGGLFVVIDELGKMLEYAAIHPDSSDLNILQQLAERASRTGDRREEAAPIVVLTILHQAFDRYAGRLSSSQRDEWRKVQGRYEDFAFVESVNETVRLLARAISLDEAVILPRNGESDVDAVLKQAHLAQHLDRGEARGHLLSALPLHPAVSLLVGPLFRRLAQNERSLFAFLASGETNSFLDVLDSSRTSSQSSLFGEQKELPYYRLDHLYDYLVGSLGALLYHESMGKLWAETEAALSGLKESSALSERLIKQIALLSFAGGMAGLRPTSEMLLATADAQPDEIEAALKKLQEERVLTYRPFKSEYHIWQGSDFDLAERMREARELVTARTPLATMLEKVLPPTPMVARYHSYRTGTTRVFEVQYSSDETWGTVIQSPHTRADGRIVYVLPEHDSDIKALAQSLLDANTDAMTLVALPDGVASLREVVRELACLEWVRTNASELAGDAVARREVDEQYADLSSYVQRRLADLLVTGNDGRNPCRWIHGGTSFRLENERALQETLSSICDSVFDSSPEIWNELLNRRKPSPSAKRGLKLLIEAMITNGEKDQLGIAGHPAEYGMYASILSATGMHRRTDNRVWKFAKPDEKRRPGCVAVWETIEAMLEGADGQRLPVTQIYEALSKPPFGVREGLLPVFLFAYYKYAEQEIAIYETGSFVKSVDFEMVERFLKNPEKFELQMVRIEGVRVDVLQRLAPLVGLPVIQRHPLPFVIRLLRHVHGLAPYVRRTANLSPLALAVREALTNAVEPATLLFDELPQACGEASFLRKKQVSEGTAERFVQRLQDALRELTGAYEALVADIQRQVAHAFRLQSKTAEDRRHELAQRARPVLTLAADLSLRSFLVRATDEILDTQGWYESLASLLGRRPPVQWADEDVKTFNTALREVTRRFFALEPIAFDSEDDSHGSDGDIVVPLQRLRLGVTAQHGAEREAVVQVSSDEKVHVERLLVQLEDILSSEPISLEAKLAAISRLALKLLDERESTILEDDQIYE
jgi:hypothetical protein